jgi:PAS domain S-box-containing protein
VSGWVIHLRAPNNFLLKRTLFLFAKEVFCMNMKLPPSYINSELVMKPGPHVLTGVARGRTANIVAVSAIAVSILTVAVLGPIARKPLLQIDAFIPAYEAALAITDLITVFLLYGQFIQEKSASLLILGCGYLFNALIIICHALTFPGVFSASGLLGAGPQTTAWLYLFWHGGFALSVLGYAVLSRRVKYSFRHTGRASLCAAGGTVALVAGLTTLSTAGHRILPIIMDGPHYSIAITTGISPSICLISLIALYLLWQRRNRSALDLWLLVVMCAWLCDVILSAIVGASRFDLGWYGGRSFGLLASSFLLVMLLQELNEFHARATRADLHRATALFEAVINMTPDLVFVKDLQSRALLRNPAARFGRTWEEMEGLKEAEWHSKPGEVEQVVANDRQVIASGKSMQFVERFTTNEGERILLSTKSPLFDEVGDIVGTIGVSTDITERENRARHVEFIMRELSHRSKNLLSVIIAIARQSAKQSTTVEDYCARFEERLSALARLHDLLVQEEWRGASLQAVGHSQIAPFAGSRVRTEGPDVRLRPDVAQTICMVFHELATNASKYGALSNEKGAVAVTWGIIDAGERRLFIQWQERNGPPVVTPQRRGFGTVVVERMSLQVNGASASLKYPSSGVIWYLEAPYESFIQAPSHSGNGAAAAEAEFGIAPRGIGAGIASHPAESPPA